MSDAQRTSPTNLIRLRIAAKPQGWRFTVVDFADLVKNPTMVLSRLAADGQIKAVGKNPGAYRLRPAVIYQATPELKRYLERKDAKPAAGFALGEVW